MCISKLVQFGLWPKLNALFTKERRLQWSGIPQRVEEAQHWNISGP